MLTLLHHQDKPLTETPYDTLSPTEGLKNQEKENIRVWISCMKPYGAHPYINIIKININRFQEPSFLLNHIPISLFWKSHPGVFPATLSSHGWRIVFILLFQSKESLFQSKQEFSGNMGDGWWSSVWKPWEGRRTQSGHVPFSKAR